MSKKKTIYQDIPHWGDVDTFAPVSKDFLPHPKDLVFRPKLKKVTLVLHEESIDFFKQKASQLNTSYQGMIRSLLDEYTKHWKKIKSE